MAKATLENAVLDAELRAQGRSLADYLGAVRDRVACGVSVGIARPTQTLLEQVSGYLARGVPPHQAEDRTGDRRRPRPRGPRGDIPAILLSVDANAAYRSPTSRSSGRSMSSAS